MENRLKNGEETNLLTNFNCNKVINIKQYKIGDKIYKIGDVFEIGEPSSKNEVTSNAILTSTNKEFSLNYYKNLFIRKLYIIGNYHSFVPSSYKGKKFKIKEITLEREEPTDYYILYVYFSFQNKLLSKKLKYDYYSHNLEKALKSGELIDTEIGVYLTREKAIIKLKKAKELLELEVITQEKYDSLKTKLTPIIIEDQL